MCVCVRACVCVCVCVCVINMVKNNIVNSGVILSNVLEGGFSAMERKKA